jgi:hypothetical protein
MDVGLSGHSKVEKKSLVSLNAAKLIMAMTALHSTTNDSTA